MFMLVISSGCQKKTDQVSESKALMELDKEFSNHSLKVGPNKAFLDYIDEQAVLLRPNTYPIVGKEKIAKRYSEPDTGIVLTWEPSYSFVSKSGDLGYTYGVYHMKSPSPEGEPVINEGTYVTIWKKNDEGQWKFVLDAGNPGVERKKPDIE